MSDVPTPFHLYDEKGIRENARRVNEAFAWNKGFKEYFAVKATPNRTSSRSCRKKVRRGLLQLHGTSDERGLRFPRQRYHVLFHDTPVRDMQKAYELGAYINLDDLTHVEFLQSVAGCPKPSAAVTIREACSTSATGLWTIPAMPNTA